MDRKRASRVKLGVISFIIVLTVCHWIILAFKLPVFTGILGWFWHFIDKPPASFAAALAMVLSVATASGLIARLKQKYALKLILLILLGTTLQYEFVLLEGRGFAPLQERIETSGHFEFAQLAIRYPNPLALVRNYESLLQQKRLGRYPNTKPPGQLLFYIFFARLAEIVLPHSPGSNPLSRLEFLMQLVWPLFSCLVLIPLFLLASLWLNSDQAVRVCLFYILIPSVDLITMHTDQVLYPLLFMTCLAAAAHAARSKRFAAAAGTGFLIYLSGFFSFSLFLAVPLAAALFISLSRRFPGVNSDSGALGFKTRARFLIKMGSGLVTGLVTGMILFKLFLNYDCFLRFAEAMRYHIAWTAWKLNIMRSHMPDGKGIELPPGLLNLFEFCLWTGIPLAFLIISSGFRALGSLLHSGYRLRSAFSFTFFSTIIYLAFFAHTYGEVARLWIFLIPLACLFALDEFHNIFDNQKLYFYAIILLQFGTIFLTKIHQDFW